MRCGCSRRSGSVREAPGSGQTYSSTSPQALSSSVSDAPFQPSWLTEVLRRPTPRPPRARQGESTLAAPRPGWEGHLDAHSSLFHGEDLDQVGPSLAGVGGIDPSDRDLDVSDRHAGAVRVLQPGVDWDPSTGDHRFRGARSDHEARLVRELCLVRPATGEVGPEKLSASGRSSSGMQAKVLQTNIVHTMAPPRTARVQPRTKCWHSGFIATCLSVMVVVPRTADRWGTVRSTVPH